MIENILSSGVAKPEGNASKRAGPTLAGALTAVILSISAPCQAQGTLRIGMTAADIPPTTTGEADQGGEGQRFMANTLYDQLVMWGLSSADNPSTLTPGLAQPMSGSHQQLESQLASTAGRLVGSFFAR